ncbi:MAG: histidine kinase [Betaproteobacteria bacterium HGW-Betaproteobacteria-10]|nr:MAG: histidine kinase [Betaproteobacteria bacterium HGW-Betaproteobacteria-10]
MRRHRPLSLHTRISLVLTGLTASLLLVLAGLWLQQARAGIHEEVEAANRVSMQWLSALSGEMQSVPPSGLTEHVLGVIKPLGRIRANSLALFTADGRPLYRSPPPTYKAGRSTPGWFATLLTPTFTESTIAIDGLRLQLTPDPSRSLIDAWDDLSAMFGWALLLLAGLFITSHSALNRALRPLDQVMQALDRTGSGRFDTRLPVFATPELGRLSRAFNGMADRLIAAVNDNVRLETEREVDAHLQQRLDAERSAIARELHDELAQGITAVRALAGAIAQRTTEQPALNNYAQNIVGVTGEMQNGVRGILHRLRPPPSHGLAGRLERIIAAWQLQHQEISLSSRLALGEQPVSDEVAQATIRIVQEGLTNIVRHAGASCVELLISRPAGRLQISLSDNGIGDSGQPSPQAGSGLGLPGMAERIALLGGQLSIDRKPDKGYCLRASLPDLSPLALPEKQP